MKTSCIVNRPGPKDEPEAHRFHGVRRPFDLAQGRERIEWRASRGSQAKNAELHMTLSSFFNALSLFTALSDS